MEQLIEFYAKRDIKPNEGYKFIKIESVFLPILQVNLIVTKRDYYGLPLLDEIVLRLIDEDVHEISELVNILGIDRNLLEVSLADLCVKDLIYCTANQCKLMEKGRNALNDLSVIQRSKECLKNVYLDPINNSVLLDYENINLIKKVNDNGRKLDAYFEKNDINVFKKNIESIRQIFDEEMAIYQDKTKVKPSELLSIDEIENVYPRFVKLSFAIFVSESGLDIDIMSVDNKMEMILAQYKEEIITQIRNHKLLGKVFTKYALKKNYYLPTYEENHELVELSKKYYRIRNNPDEKEEIKLEIERQIYTNRKLRELEFDYLLSYFCKNSESFEINVDHLDDWCFGNDLFVSILSKIGGKKIKSINYSTVHNFETCMRNINKSLIGFDKDRFRQINNLPYFSIKQNDGWTISINPEDIPILDNNTHIYHYEYILENIN